jgi:SAM-dependent methyltransferase
MPAYDLELFLKLNAEWQDRPLVPRPRTVNDPGELTEQARTRGRTVSKHVTLNRKRVLEIGCGRGSFVRVLTDEYGCDATGIDLTRYPEWGDDPRFVQGDIADPPDLGNFDVIVSHAVWEHVEHPYGSLVNQRDLLAPGGIAYLYANLYRGPKASHRYREVYFPWPHLLFTDDVFEDFYEHLGQRPRRAAWVNRLTYAHYLHHFDRIGYDLRRVWPSRPWWDEEFYRQHWDTLGRYPEWDLQHDFIHAVLARDPETRVRHHGTRYQGAE